MTNTDKNIEALLKDQKDGCVLRFVRLGDQHIRKFVPKGCYCYDENGVCPFWDKFDSYPDQMNGYCSLLEIGDWMSNSPGLLWDQCKTCGINDDDESLYGPVANSEETNKI